MLNPSTGTLYLLARTHSSEPWHELNRISFSDELAYLNAFTALEAYRSRHILDSRTSNWLYKITTESIHDTNEPHSRRESRTSQANQA